MADGDWLDTVDGRLKYAISADCGVCGKPYAITDDRPWEAHCGTCEMGLRAIRAMVTAKEDGGSIDAGRGYYVALFVEAMASRLHKLDARVKELEGWKHDRAAE